jgi:hypothetical protein
VSNLLTDIEVAQLRDWLRQQQPAEIGVKEPETEPVPEYEALAKEIAAKYGLKNIHSRAKEIVALYEYVAEIVSADNVLTVFSAAVEKVFKF